MRFAGLRNGSSRELWLGIAGAVFLACAGDPVAATSVEHWNLSGHSGIVRAELCGVCSFPYDYQERAAREHMSEACGQRRFTILEEGKGLSPEYSALVKAPLGLVRRYYWAFSCAVPGVSPIGSPGTAKGLPGPATPSGGRP